MSEVAFKKLTLAEKIFQSLVWQPLVSAAIVWLESYFPFLKVPVVRQVNDLLVREMGNWIYKNFVMCIDVTAIKLSNSIHQDMYEKASLKLMLLAMEQGEGSEEFKRVNEEAKLALAQFVQYGATK